MSGVHVPAGVRADSYKASIPLIRRSKLTTRDRGGIGKHLSDGWCLNFAVGCTHACPFCYVDAIHKRFGPGRYGDSVLRTWGDYLLVPSNLEDAIERTPWSKWKGIEVMLSSTHDPYLPTLAPWARRILARALEEGVRFCVQTRSYLVTKDMDLLEAYHNQVRLQVSIATMDRDFARLIEPRVPPPEARVDILRRAQGHGLKAGLIMAPIFPPVGVRPEAGQDIRSIVRALDGIRLDHVYGESLHVRGQNMRLLEAALGERVIIPPGFDDDAARVFRQEWGRRLVDATWWYERPEAVS